MRTTPRGPGTPPSTSRPWCHPVRGENFLRGEIDPNRVPPRCYYRARAQDILTLAREQFGEGATVDTMFAILKERKEDGSDPDEVD